MEYTLHRAPRHTQRCQGASCPIVPPRPGKGERKPRPYSPDDLNSLWATGHSINWQALVTLNPPPLQRIITWPGLREVIKQLKQRLTNWRRRKGFPATLLVTEFDPVGDSERICANFHLGFAETLSHEAQAMLREWWLGRFSLPDNKGRAFQYDANGGGQQLQDYLCKDVSWREGTRRHVKFPASWLPHRTDCRLWFAVGIKRRPAREGARLWKARGKRPRRWRDSKHGRAAEITMTASTGSPDSTHAPASITAASKAVPPSEAPTLTIHLPPCHP